MFCRKCVSYAWPFVLCRKQKKKVTMPLMNCFNSRLRSWGLSNEFTFVRVFLLRKVLCDSSPVTILSACSENHFYSLAVAVRSYEYSSDHLSQLRVYAVSRLQRRLVREIHGTIPITVIAHGVVQQRCSCETNLVVFWIKKLINNIVSWKASSSTLSYKFLTKTLQWTPYAHIHTKTFWNRCYLIGWGRLLHTPKKTGVYTGPPLEPDGAQSPLRTRSGLNEFEIWSVTTGFGPCSTGGGPVWCVIIRDLSVDGPVWWHHFSCQSGAMLWTPCILPPSIALNTPPRNMNYKVLPGTKMRTTLGALT